MPKPSTKIYTITADDLTPFVLSLYEVKTALDKLSMRLTPRRGGDEWILLKRTGKSHFSMDISGKVTTEKIRLGGIQAVNNFLADRCAEQLKFA